MEVLKDRAFSALLELLRAGLWEREVEDLSLFPLDEKQWRELYKISHAQTVTGIVYRGISYLPEEAQMQLYETIDYNDATPSHYQAIRLRNFHRDGKLTPEVIEAIMSEEKPNQKEKSPFRDKRIVGVIPKNIPQEKHCEYVIKAIDFYNRHLERVRNNRSR